MSVSSQGHSGRAERVNRFLWWLMIRYFLTSAYYINIVFTNTAKCNTIVILFWIRNMSISVGQRSLTISFTRGKVWTRQCQQPCPGRRPGPGLSLHHNSESRPLSDCGLHWLSYTCMTSSIPSKQFSQCFGRDPWHEKVKIRSVCGSGTSCCPKSDVWLCRRLGTRLTHMSTGIRIHVGEDPPLPSVVL